MWTHQNLGVIKEMRKLTTIILLMTFLSIFMAACSPFIPAGTEETIIIPTGISVLNENPALGKTPDGTPSPPSSFSTDIPQIQTLATSTLNPRRGETEEYKIPSKLLPFDGIRPVYAPEFGDVLEVDIRDNELVMGVALGGEAKAYPVSVLKFREMVNDEIGGIPILVTW